MYICVGRLVRFLHTHTHTQGKPEIAVPFCKKAVLELKQKKGSEDPDVAAMLNILAVIYRFMLYIYQDCIVRKCCMNVKSGVCLGECVRKL